MANTLAAKIAKASQDVGGRLKADKTNMQDRYDYISANKILAECGQALAAVGVSVIPSMTDVFIDIGETAGGKRRFDARVVFVMTITDGETELSQPWFGFGADYTTPDKAVYKAVTSGHKYFLQKLLMVGEGNEDGEHEPAPEQTEQRHNGNGHGNGHQAPPPQNGNDADKPSDKQQKALHAKGMDYYGSNEVWKLKRAELVKSVTHGRSESSSDLTRAEMKKLLDGLDAKIKERDGEITADNPFEDTPEMAF